MMRLIFRSLRRAQPCSRDTKGFRWPKGPSPNFSKNAPSAAATWTRRSPIRLQAFADEVRALNPEFADVVERMVAGSKAAGVGDEAPRPGDPMPDFLLPDQTWPPRRPCRACLENGPVVIAFHRGHWCPYCRINASALAAIHGEVKALGAELVAITPEIEKFNAELQVRRPARVSPFSPTWTTATRCCSTSPSTSATRRSSS